MKKLTTSMLSMLLAFVMMVGMTQPMVSAFSTGDTSLVMNMQEDEDNVYITYRIINNTGGEIEQAVYYVATSAPVSHTEIIKRNDGPANGQGRVTWDTVDYQRVAMKVKNWSANAATEAEQTIKKSDIKDGVLKIRYSVSPNFPTDNDLDYSTNEEFLAKTGNGTKIETFQITPAEQAEETEYNHYYVKNAVYVRDANTDKVVSVFPLGKYVKGYREGDNVYFKYNNKLVKIHYSYLLQENASNMYIVKPVNVRNSDMKVVDVAYPTKKIKAVRIGNYYRYYDNGEKFVWHSFVGNNNALESTYALGDVYIRSTNTNRVLGYLKKGEYQPGVVDGDYVYFNLNGTTAKVHESFRLKEKPIVREIIKAVNVRNSDMKKVGVKRAGEKIKAVRIGDYYRYYDRGIKFIWHSFAE